MAEAGAAVAAAAVALLVCARSVGAQSAPAADCREPWLPKDAPGICAFTAAPHLPAARTYHASAATPSMLYVAGGYVFDGKEVRYLDDLLYARIRPDGTLADWARASNRFTHGRSGLGLGVLGKCLVLAGGSWFADGKAEYASDVQTSALAEDGTPGPWRTGPHRLNVARSNATLLAYTGPNGSYLYAVGGVTQIGSDVVHLDDLEYARVNEDCSTSAWTRAAYHLRGGRSTPQAVLTGDQITVVGGWGDLDVVDVYSDVQLTRIRADGAVEPWRTASTRLPTGLYGHATVVAETPRLPSLLLTVGGQPGTGAYANWIAYAYLYPSVAPINAITQWSIAPVGRLPEARAGHSAQFVNGILYVIGGTTPAGRYLDEVLQAKISPGTP
jgi:hypothetical protein